MRSKCGQAVWFVLLAATMFGATPAGAQIWKNFVPTSHSEPPADSRSLHQPANSNSEWATDVQSMSVPADQRQARGDANAFERRGSDGGSGDYALTQDSGPWLIVAASFSGTGSEQQAHNLAAELRERFHLHAYVHEIDSNFRDDSENSRGQSGETSRRHYRRGDEARELAVLVGDFPSIDGPDAQQMLSRVKTLQPNALNVDPNQTTQSMAQARQVQNAILEKLGKSKKRGPMGQAFFTRNPLLPREYFVPKGVDAFVAKMNEGVEHSLLDNPGRQTIQVATFRGKTILQTSATEDPSTKSFWGGHKNNDKNPLVEAAENAHLLAKELRSHGFDAYEFHDRTESIVAIGAFAQTTQQLPDGRMLFGGMRLTRADRDIGYAPAARQNAPPIEPAVVAALEAALPKLVPAAAGARTERHWSGVMDFTADHQPIIGAWPGRPGLWLLVGFSGHGMPYSQVLPYAVAAQIAGKDGPAVPAAFAPGRILR